MPESPGTGMSLRFTVDGAHAMCMASVRSSMPTMDSSHIVPFQSARRQDHDPSAGAAEPSMASSMWPHCGLRLMFRPMSASRRAPCVMRWAEVALSTWLVALPSSKSRCMDERPVGLGRSLRLRRESVRARCGCVSTSMSSRPTGLSSHALDVLFQRWRAHHHDQSSGDTTPSTPVIM